MNPIYSSLWWFKRRFPHLAWKLRWLRPSRRRERRRYLDKSTREVFQYIYQNNMWGMEESRSGAGSTLRATEQLRADLPRVLQRLGARSLLDAPCGDFHWMQHCNLGVQHYTGGEIVPELVDKLNHSYASPSRSFVQLDITTDPLPQADVFFCRDCFLHLSFKHIHDALANFARSGCTHLIASTYRDVDVNIDHFTGGVRMVNLQHPPFNLPEPLEFIPDQGEASFQRCLGVWTREQVASALAARGD
jgi:hypothetical protein